MKLVITGEVPSQKNAKTVGFNRTTGKPFIMSKKEVKAWKATAIQELQQQFKGYRVTDYPITVTVVFYYSRDSRKDLDNSLSGVCDALVQAGVIEDDDWKHVECYVVQFGGLDKNNPRAEVFLDE